MIELRHLSKTFPGENGPVEALKDVLLLERRSRILPTVFLTEGAESTTTGDLRFSKAVA